MNLRLSSLTKGVAALAGIAVCVSSYAGSPVANEKIAVAKASVQRAEQAGAPQDAPVELAAARDKLARAEQANLKRDLKVAIILAEEATVDAEVAEAKTQQQRSHTAATEFDASMQALRQEAMRSAQPTQ